MPKNQSYLHKKDLFFVFLLFVLCTLYFLDVFVGKVLFTGDNLSINIPGKFLFWQKILNKESLGQNPYIFSGMPFLADLNLGLFSPFTLLYLFLNPFTALSYHIYLLVVMAGIGMYTVLRKTMQFTSFSSFIGAVSFMLSGSIMQHTWNTATLTVIAFIPLVFLSYDFALKTKTTKSIIVSSLILSLQFLSGHPQYFYYTLFLLFLWTLFEYWSFKNLKIISNFGFRIFNLFQINTSLFKTLFTMITFFLVLTSFQLIPFLHLAFSSTRPGNSLNYAASAAPVISLIHIVFPFFFGVVNKGTSWGATADVNGYIGFVPLIFFAYCFTVSKPRQIKFFIWLGIVSILISLGKYSPFYLACYYLLPFFSRFRNPPGILILFTFSSSIITGFVFNEMQNNKYSFSRNFLKLTLLILVVSVCSYILLQIVPVTKLVTLTPLRISLSHLLTYNMFKKQTILTLWQNEVQRTLLFIGVASGIIILFRNHAFKLALFFSLFIIADLWFVTKSIYITITPNKLQPPEKVIRFFRDRKGDYRILTYPDVGKKPEFGDAAYFEKEAIKSMSFFQVNSNILYGLKSIDGYASMVPKVYAKQFSKNFTSNPTGITIPPPSSALLEKYQVTYVLTGGRYKKELDRLASYRLVLTYYSPYIARNFYVYERLRK